MYGPVPIGFSEAASSPPSAVALGGKIAAGHAGHLLQKDRVGLLGDDPDGVVVEVVDPGNGRPVGLVGPVLLLAPLPAVLDRLPGQRLPVGELDVLPETEDVRRVVDDLPRFGQLRLDVPLGIEPEERLHRRVGDVQAVHLGAHVGIEGVDVRRDADRQRPLGAAQPSVPKAEPEREQHGQSEHNPLHWLSSWAPLTAGDVIWSGDRPSGRPPGAAEPGSYGAPGGRSSSRRGPALTLDAEPW